MKSTLVTRIKRHFNKQISDEFAGISIHPDCIRIIKIKRLDSGFECIENYHQPIESSDSLSEILLNIIERFDLAKIRSVIVIDNNKTQSAQIELSELPIADISASLPWQVKDLISIPPQDMICDYIEMDIQPLGQKPKAQIVATSRQYLEAILQPFHKENAEVLAITTEQFVLARMQSSVDSAQLVFVQHKNASAILLILKNQQICFARKIRDTENIINMSQELILTGGIDSLAIEIQRSMDYYESQLKQPPIKNVLVAIAGDNQAFIIDSLNNSLPIKVLPLPMLEISDEPSLSYLTSGAAANYAMQEGEE